MKAKHEGASSSATRASHGGVVAVRKAETEWPHKDGVEALVQQWRDDAALFRRYRQAPLADLLEDRAAELGAALEVQAERLVTLFEAARLSNYSADHLRRLRRDGKLPAKREGRRLLFRTGDLPRKPTLVDGQPCREYDPSAHARQVAIRRSHGGSHDTQEAA